MTDAVRSALEEARKAIAAAPQGVFGFGSGEDDFGQWIRWPIRDELLSKIDAALSAPEPVLPCDVLLPPATRIAKGCDMSTLIAAISMRRTWPADALAFPAAPGWNEAIEEAAKWHDAQIVELDEQIARNDEYCRSIGKAGGMASEANRACWAHQDHHRLSAAAIRALTPPATGAQDAEKVDDAAALRALEARAG